MIARIWRGVTRAEHSETYMDYLEATGLTDYAATPGFGGIQVLRRVDGGECEFLLITFWDSWDAIRAFAGEDPEVAVYYPDDDRYLLHKDPHVRHYEVPVRG